MMVPPDSAFHFHTRSRNAVRPRSSLVLPSFASWRSTTYCVAIPAWSVPGTHNALKPSIRFMRIMTSCSVLLSAWPMCSEPVTFGGGITMQYGVPGRVASVWKKPRFSHSGYQRASAAAGS
jgi:hypothetical protein